MSVRDSTRTWPRVWLVVNLCLLVAVSVWVLFGGPMLALILIVLAPALTVVRAHMSLAVSLVLLLAAASWSTVVVFIVARYTGAPPLVLVLVVTTAVGCLCAVRLYRSGSSFTRIDLADLTLLSVGAVIWCGVLPSPSSCRAEVRCRGRWAGTPRTTSFSRERFVEQGGITLGAGGTPCRSTAALIGLFMLPGRTFAFPRPLRRTSWRSRRCGRRDRRGLPRLGRARARPGPQSDRDGLVAVAVGSTAAAELDDPRGFVALGFVNFHLTLALMLGCLVMLLRPDRGCSAVDRRVVPVLTLVLALWTPLAVIPGLACSHCHRGASVAPCRLRGGGSLSGIRRSRRRSPSFAAVSLPSFLAQGGTACRSRQAPSST